MARLTEFQVPWTNSQGVAKVATCRVLRLAKGNGKFRSVVDPDPDYKTMLRSMVGRLTEKAILASPDVSHGFRPGRNPVTNALAHVGRRYTLSFDLESFFDSVIPQRVKGFLTTYEQQLTLIDPGDGLGPRACQGLPTSPAVADLAASVIDKALAKAIEKTGAWVVYTRYADDLTFSFDDPALRKWLLQMVPETVSRVGYKIAKHKTKFQPASAGNRVITGVAVGDSEAGSDGVRPTRSVRRRIRAGEQLAVQYSVRPTTELKGLQEWAKLRLPKPPVPQSQTDDARTAAILSGLWGLRTAEIAPRPIADVRVGEIIITRDPAYVLGLSTYTTGWTSCMSHPNGAFRQGAPMWLELSGLYVAALLSQTTKTFGGVTRQVMRARVLVYLLREGKGVVYGRFFGDASSCDELRRFLESRGAVPCSRKKGVRVIGNVPKGSKKPYLDTGTVVAKPAMSTGKPVYYFVAG